MDIDEPDDAVRINEDILRLLKEKDDLMASLKQTKTHKNSIAAQYQPEFDIISEHYFEYYNHEFKLHEIITLPDGRVVYNGEIDDDCVKLINNELAKLPSRILLSVSDYTNRRGDVIGCTDFVFN